MEKQCKKCQEIKSLDNFGKDKYQIDGLNKYCKSCTKNFNKINHDKRKMANRCPTCGRNKINTNRYSCDVCLVTMKKCRDKTENKIIALKYMQEYNYNRRHTDILYRLSHNLRSRLNMAIRNNYKSGSAVRDLGCSIAECKTHLENQFLSGMSWKNWGKKEGDWQIDHIKPMFMFDLSNREELLQACHYTNLRPLWKKDNISRTYEEFNI